MTVEEARSMIVPRRNGSDSSHAPTDRIVQKVVQKEALVGSLRAGGLQTWSKSETLLGFGALLWGDACGLRIVKDVSDGTLILSKLPLGSQWVYRKDA